MTRNQDMENLFGRLEIVIKEIILQILGMVMEKWTGKMKVHIKECGKRGFSMEKENYLFHQISIKKGIL